MLVITAQPGHRQPFLDLICSRTLGDGSVQYLQVSGEPMFDTSSRFIRFRGVGMDVTERMARAI